MFQGQRWGECCSDSVDSIEGVDSIKGVDIIEGIDSVEGLDNLEGIDSVEGMDNLEGLDSVNGSAKVKSHDIFQDGNGIWPKTESVSVSFCEFSLGPQESSTKSGSTSFRER